MAAWWKGLVGERRKSRRAAVSNACAYYWDGIGSQPHRLGDVSVDGAHLFTAQKFYPGTIMRIILNHSVEHDSRQGSSEGSFVLWARVVRHTPDGIGIQFLHTNRLERWMFRSYLYSLAGATQPPKAPLLRRAASSSGQSLIEFALLIPLLFLLFINVVNFGGMLYAWIGVANAARAGAQYLIRGGATVGAPSIPTTSQVAALVAQDLAGLPNKDSLTVLVCTNNNGTVTCSDGSSTAPGDPEASRFVVATVLVTYTYQPLIPLWEWPALGIHATLPPSTIQQRSAMRIMQ